MDVRRRRHFSWPKWVDISAFICYRVARCTPISQLETKLKNWIKPLECIGELPEMHWKRQGTGKQKTWEICEAILRATLLWEFFSLFTRGEAKVSFRQRDSAKGHRNHQIIWQFHGDGDQETGVWNFKQLGCEKLNSWWEGRCRDVLHVMSFFPLEAFAKSWR